MPKYVNESLWTHIGEWQLNQPLFDSKYWLDDTTGCYQWLGAAGPQGGLFGAKKQLKPRMIQARRVAWMLANNEDITDNEIRHSCHNNMCVNPAHMSKHPKKHRSPDA